MGFGQELKRTNRNMPCNLTAQELASKAQELAETVQEVNNEELNQKSIKDQLKAKLTELQSKQSRLASIVARKEEYRDVAISVISMGDGKVQEVRMDTGEALTTREMNESEKQAAFAI